MVEQGFDDPVLAAQNVFRTLLAASAEPGRVLSLPSFCTPPEGLDAAALAVVLALCDGDTPLWLGPRYAAAASFLRFHTGAPIVAAPGEASFVLADAAERPALSALRQGTPEYPDHSATLILSVARLVEGEGWRLSGPGIAGSRRFAAELDAGFLGEWRQNRAGFPLGVDLVLTAHDRIAALPRGILVEG